MAGDHEPAASTTSSASRTPPPVTTPRTRLPSVSKSVTAVWRSILPPPRSNASATACTYLPGVTWPSYGCSIPPIAVVSRPANSRTPSRSNSSASSPTFATWAASMRPFASPSSVL